MPQNPSVVCIGAALTDCVAEIDLQRPDVASLDITPGGMTLISEAQAKQIASVLRDVTYAAGGSAANTAAIIAALGGDIDVVFVGKTCSDKTGRYFRKAMELDGVRMPLNASARPEASSGVCFSLISGEDRTMATCLGEAARLTAADLDETLIANADIIFLESYLLDSPGGTEVFEKCAYLALGDIALTLSDPACVRRHKEFLLGYIGRITVLLANKSELMALYDASDVEYAMQTAAASVTTAVCTLSAEGALVSELGTVYQIPAVPASFVDATGAGDSFAGTLIHGLVQRKRVVEAASRAAHIASIIVSQKGARPCIDISKEGI